MAYYSSAGSPILDEHPTVTLRPRSAPAITASAAEAPVEFDATQSGANGGPYWEDYHPNFLGMAVVIHAHTVDTADGDETYTVTVEVSTDQAFTTPIVVGSTSITAAGKHVVILHGPTVQRLAPNAKWIRVNAAVGGTTPSLDYSAWVSSMQSTVGQVG